MSFRGGGARIDPRRKRKGFRSSHFTSFGEGQRRLVHRHLQVPNNYILLSKFNVFYSLPQEFAVPTSRPRQITSLPTPHFLPPHLPFHHKLASIQQDYSSSVMQVQRCSIIRGSPEKSQPAHLDSTSSSHPPPSREKMEYLRIIRPWTCIPEILQNWFEINLPKLETHSRYLLPHRT